MANERDATLSPGISCEAERGAGGKLRRQPARKAPATPYSRPPQNLAQRSRWISRIVDPAYRIIAGGATKILPYFFTKADTDTALPAPLSQDQDKDQFQYDLKERVDDCNPIPSLNNLEPRTPYLGGTSSTANRGETNSSIRTQAKGKMVLNDNGGLSELERLVDGRQFSRDEVERLIEIINSRAVDVPVAERVKKSLESPLEEAKKFMISIEGGKKPSGGKEAMNNDLWTTSTPLPKTTIPDEVGLSPIELARAYMGEQTPTFNSKCLMSRDERDLLHGDMFAAKPFITSPLSKPSTCWPGAKLTEQRGFATPQSQRERFGLHNFPRTPYSRTIFSKSKSKLMQLHNDSSKCLNIPQSPSHDVQSPYSQFKLSKEVDANHQSVGPNRRLRHRAITETTSRFSPYSRSVGPRQSENSEGFFPAIKKNLEAGELSNFSRSQGTSGKHKTPEMGTPTVPPHSSQISRMILEHLERNQPTPKDKSAELKLATSWRKSQSSDIATQSSLNFDNNASRNMLARTNENKGSFFSSPRPFVHNASSGTTDETENGASKAPPASNGIFGGKRATDGSGPAPLFESGKSKDSLVKSRDEEDSEKAVPSASVAEAAPTSQKAPSHSQGSKPTLPSISITKPMQKWTFPSESSSSFTFPVSSSSGASSEPPTPSFVPFSSSTVVSNQQQTDQDEEIPIYSFRSNSSSGLVFSLPSGIDDHDNEVDDDIKFTFGSENADRICFNSLGEDVACC